MLNNIKPLYLHCVFHGIRFKVNNEDWLSVTDSLFLYIQVSVMFIFNYLAGTVLLNFRGYPKRIANSVPNPNK